MKAKSKKLGFTLIEIIVVITIISVLSLVAIVSFTGSSKKSRDARRMADLERIRIALETYRQENGSYPANGSALSPIYLSEWPSDPKGGVYYYVIGGTNYTYSLYGRMEDAGTTMAWSGYPSSNCGGQCNYKLVNP